MKNIHVLPTDKPSRLFIYNGDLGCAKVFQYGSDAILNQHIYITDDSEIKDCYYFNSKDNAVRKNNNSNHPYHHKIILTTDIDLIKDGVQAVEEDFLNWFVKNSSCDSVEILEAPKLVKMIDNEFYKIIIPKEELSKDEIDKFFIDMVLNPKEEPKKIFNLPIATNLVYSVTEKPKQETLEEAALKWFMTANKREIIFDLGWIKIFEAGAKWQQEQIGKSEFLQKLRATKSDAEARRLIFEQFKNK